MALFRLAGVGLLVDRHQAHEPHQPPDALRVHTVSLVPQIPGHLPDTVEGRLEELLVNVSCCRFCGHIDKIVSWNRRADNDETDLQP